jgi:hypothetical protein
MKAFFINVSVKKKPLFFREFNIAVFHKTTEYNAKNKWLNGLKKDEEE